MRSAPAVTMGLLCAGAPLHRYQQRAVVAHLIFKLLVVRAAQALHRLAVPVMG